MIALVYQGGPTSRHPIVTGMRALLRKYDMPVIEGILPYDLNQHGSRAVLERLYQMGVRTYIGWEGSQAMDAGMPFFQAHPDTAAISVGSTSTIQALDDNIYRLNIPDSNYVDAMLKYARVEGYRRIAILWDEDSEWARSIRNDILQRVPMAIDIPFLTDDDPKGTLDMALASADPEDTLVLLFIAKQYDQFFRMTRPFWKQHMYHVVAGDGAEGYMFPNLDDVADSMRFTVAQMSVPTTTIMQNPIVNGSVTIALIVDAYMLARDAGRDPNAYLSALRGINGVDGHTGFISFDDNGDRDFGDVAMMHFQDGKYRPTYIYFADPAYGTAFAKVDV